MKKKIKNYRIIVIKNIKEKEIQKTRKIFYINKRSLFYEFRHGLTNLIKNSFIKNVFKLNLIRIFIYKFWNHSITQDSG